MEGEKQNQMLDREIRDMISALNRRLQHLHKPHGEGDSSHNDDDHEADDDHGVRVITLAGSNVGATMRSELDDHLDDNVEDDPLTAFVNSNFQAINNSLMLGGSYTTNDPGVHMEISDDYNITKHETKTDLVQQKRAKKKEGGTKNKGSKTLKSEHHSEGNSGD